jgi:hypothetical protein
MDMKLGRILRGSWHTRNLEKLRNCWKLVLGMVESVNRTLRMLLLLKNHASDYVERTIMRSRGLFVNSLRIRT